MSLSAITWSILIQLAIFLFVHGCMFFPRVDPDNYLYIGTICDFLAELSLGTIWVVTFHKWFPGQCLVYVALSMLLIVSLFVARKKHLRLKAVCFFHLAALAWIFLPVLAWKLGTYTGP